MGAIRISADATARDSVIAGVPASGPNPPAKADFRATFGVVEDEVDAVRAAIPSSLILEKTWSALAARSTAGLVAGSGAEIIDDAGTHTDPVVGGTVSNSGRFRYSTSPAGWERIGAPAFQDNAAAAAASAAVYTDSFAPVTWAGGATAAQIKTAIQNAITGAAGKTVVIGKPGTWTLNSGITIPSDTAIQILPGVNLTKAAGQTDPMFVNAGCAGSTANTNIRIWGGGTITGNGDPVTYSRAGVIGEIALIGVSNGHVRDLTFANCQRGVQHSGSDFQIENITATSSATAPVTLNGPSSRQAARNIRQASEGVAVIVAAWGLTTQVPVPLGSITDFEVEHITNTGALGSHVALTAGTTGTRADIERGRIRGLYGTAGDSVVRVLDRAGATLAGVGTVNDVIVEDARATATNGSVILSIEHTVGDIGLVGFSVDDLAANSYPVGIATTGVVSGRLTVDGGGTFSGTGERRVVSAQGGVNECMVRGSYTFGSAGNDDGLVVVPGNATAYVTTLIIDTVTQNLGGAFLYKASGSADQTTTVYVSESRLIGAKRAWFAVGSDVDIRSSDVAYTGLTVNFVRADTAAVTAREVNTTLALGGGATEIVLVSGGAFARPSPITIPGDYVVTNTGAAYAEIQAALTAVKLAGGGVCRIMQPGTLTIDSGQTLVVSGGTELVFGLNTKPIRAASSTGTPSLIRNENVILTGHANIVDEDITIRGGVWDGNYANGNTGRGNNDGAGIPANGLPAGSYGMIVMLGVRRLKIADMRIQQNSGCAIQFVGEYLTIDNITAGDADEYQFDFIHVNGPSRYGSITNIKGWTHDDMVALNAWDWGIAGPCVGDITDFYVGQLWQTAPQVNTNTTGSFVRLLSGTRAGVTANVRDIVIEDLYGMISGSAGILTDPTADPSGTAGGTNVPGTGVIENITVNNVGEVRLFNACPLILLAQANIRNVTLDGAVCNEGSTGKLIKATAAADVNLLTLRDITAGAALGAEGYVECKGRIRRLVLEASDWVGFNDGSVTSGASGQQTFIYVEGAAGWIDEIDASNFRQAFGETWLQIASNTTLTTIRVNLTGCGWDNVKHPFWIYRGTVEVRATNCHWVNIPNNMARADGAAASIHMIETGCDFSASGGGVPYTRLNSATIRHQGAHMPVNADKDVINGFQNGDQMRNSNAALACGAGLILSNGTTHKNLYSGATY